MTIKGSIRNVERGQMFVIENTETKETARIFLVMY